MKFIPKLFKTDMVQAIKAGTKTQTRRTQGLEFINEDEIIEWEYVGVSPPAPGGGDKYMAVFKAVGYSSTWAEVPLPAAKGDVIWVRETFNTNWDGIGFIYKADYVDPAKNKTFWKPSLFMPRAACRYWLKIKDIRVEILQNIIEEDAKAEGIERWIETRMKSQPEHYKVYFQDCKPEDAMSYTSSAVNSYETLWQSINGGESWDKNPFVWVYEFEVLTEKPEGFL